MTGTEANKRIGVALSEIESANRLYPSGMNPGRAKRLEESMSKVIDACPIPSTYGVRAAILKGAISAWTDRSSESTDG